jgi:hypothetical protein
VRREQPTKPIKPEPNNQAAAGKGMLVRAMAFVLQDFVIDFCALSRAK